MTRFERQRQHGASRRYPRPSVQLDAPRCEDSDPDVSSSPEQKSCTPSLGSQGQRWVQIGQCQSALVTAKCRHLLDRPVAWRAKGDRAWPLISFERDVITIGCFCSAYCSSFAHWCYCPQGAYTIRRNTSCPCAQTHRQEADCYRDKGLLDQSRSLMAQRWS